MIENLILLISGILSVFIALILLNNYKSNGLINYYFILIVITISVRYLLLGVAYMLSNEFFTVLGDKYSSFAIILIPFFYLYFQKLSHDNRVFNKKELLHFIFPILFFGINSSIDNLKINFEGIRYGLFFIFFVYLILYLFASFKLLKQTIWIKKENINSNTSKKVINSKWTLFLFLAMLFTVLRLVGATLFELRYENSIHGNHALWISAVIWVIILFKIVVSPEILYGHDVLLQKNSEKRNRNLLLKSVWNTNVNFQINNEQHLQLRNKIGPHILTYIEEIEKITFNEQIFRNPAITLVDVANKLNMPKSHISYLFKYHSKISFSDYKKRIRIHDALMEIDGNYLQNNTLESLSQLVGFTSYNTFFTSFKEISGKSPVEYLNIYKAQIRT